MVLLSIKGGAFRPNDVSMEAIHRYAGTSRQWLSQRLVAQAQQGVMFDKIQKLVEAHRVEKDRRAGSRNLYYTLDIGECFGIGVTKFEQLMSKNGMSLAPLRTRVVTTQSDKQSWNYEDIANGLIINNINQLIVGDLTYVYLNGKLYYLFCLTDVYSARIVGYYLNNRMRAVDAIKALESCIMLRGKHNLAGCKHHTDGGRQYFSTIYLKQINDCGMVSSCAKSCLQNGYAEQRNGLIKNHLLPTLQQTELAEICKELDKTFYFYNYERKQEALGWRSPVAYEAFITVPANRVDMKLYHYVPT